MGRLRYFLLAACLGVLMSCGKDAGKDEARYYVKYTGETSTLHIVETTYTVATDTGFDTYKTTGSRSDYSVTIGPVKKGFQASIWRFLRKVTRSWSYESDPLWSSKVTRLS